MRYATKQAFGGQRASVGRDVTVKDHGDILAAKVVGVSGDDLPILRIFGRMGSGSEDGGANHHREEISFADVRAEADIEKAPATCWFWPPRV